MAQNTPLQFSLQMTKDNFTSVVMKLPQTHMVGLVPFIVAAIITAIEILICFVYIVQGYAVFSASIIYVHMTWGLIFSITLNFIENSLRWSLNRRLINVFGFINFVASIVFIIACLYTWLWSNDGAGMAWICKNFLSSTGITLSPQKIYRYIYTPKVQTAINVLISWFLPVQCCIVAVDCGLSVFRKGKNRNVGLLLRTDYEGNIFCMVDVRKLF